jgi:hypothetical protein
MALADVRDGNGSAALRILANDAVVSECLGHWIEFIKELLTADPKRVGMILKKRINDHAAQTVRARGLVLEDFVPVAIESV